MEVMHGLTEQQMIEVYRHVRDFYLKREIEEYLIDSSYFIRNREYNGREIIKHLDLDRLVTNFKEADEFNYDLVEALIDAEISNNIDSIIENYWRGI